MATALVTAAKPLGTAFTYQGQLKDGGTPATGHYDLIFNLYDAPTNGNAIGTFSIFGAVPVTNGLFTVELNADNEFGTNAFNGEARWLQIGVRTNSNNALNPWINLDPRQPLDCTPQALFALKASNAMTASFASSVADGSISSSKLAPGAVAWTNITGIPLNAAMPYSAGPGLSLSWLNQFSVSFAGSGVASTAARSDHQHFGSAWSGSNSFGSGLGVTNSSTSSAVGLYGQQGTGSSFPYLFGNTAGVWGESSQGSGVWGASGFAIGAGVAGVATATNTANVGVSGTSFSTAGIGVRGLASATSGFALGIRGETKSSGGYGIAGYASSLAGTATGVYGESSAINGAGLYGHSTFVSGNGPNYGVIGQSDSIYGYGVYGHASSANGLTFGVVGQSDSPSGIGVVGRNSTGVSIKAEGTGIIQSDADSYFWVSADSAQGHYVDMLRFPNVFSVSESCCDEGMVFFPLDLPMQLYGQSTTVKSIEIFYKTGPADDGSHITGTAVQMSDGESGTNVYLDQNSHISTTRSSYTIPVNHTLTGATCGLSLVIYVDVSGFYYNNFYGIKVRLGHK